MDRLLDLFLRAIRRKAIRRPRPPYIPPATDLVVVLNEFRLAAGVRIVWECLQADQAAQVQADWQARLDRIGHDGPPSSPTHVERLRASGATFVLAADEPGEICAQGERAYWPDGRIAIDYDFRTACRDWLESPGHRRCLLDPRWTHAGAAMATNPTSGQIYSTAVFYREN
jgi:uncharacterized protein YkwD